MGGIVTRTGTGTVTMGVGECRGGVGDVGGVGVVGGVGGVGVSEKSIPARGSDVVGADVAGADVAGSDVAGASVAAGDVAAGDSSGKKRSRTEHSSASAMAYILSMVGLPWM